MSLNTLIKSLSKGEILLPLLRNFLEEEYRKECAGEVRHKEIVAKDAQMTIDCFQDRLNTYNHGEPVGEFFHPSQLGACLRQMWYGVKGAPSNSKPTADELLKRHIVFEMGTYIHVLFQNLCERAGVLECREKTVNSRLHKLLGHADGILKIEGNRYLLEIKTSNSRRFTQLTKEPQHSHRKQMMAYMKALKLDWAIIVYINKDNSATKEFVIPYDEAFYQKECAKRIEEHFDNLKQSVPPKREGLHPDQMPCSFCEFSRICFDSQMEGKFLKTLCKSGKSQNQLPKGKPVKIQLQARKSAPTLRFKNGQSLPTP